MKPAMKHNLLLVSTISICFTFAGCKTVGPDYVVPASRLPEAFSATTAGNDAGSEQIKEWWRHFGDAELSALIADALTQNPDVAMADTRLRQSRAFQSIQDSATAPTVNATGRVSKDTLSQNGEQFANVPLKHPLVEFTNRQIGFDASWEIDFWGHQQRLSEAAGARTQASVARMHDVQLVLVAEVARNYIEFRAAQQRLQFAIENGRNYDESLRLTQFARQHGELNQLDVERVQAQKNNFQASLPNFHQTMRQNIVALSNLTTLSLTELEQRLSHTSDLLPVPPPPAIGIPADLLVHRPDVQAAERDLAAASADVGVAVSDLYPRFSLGGNAGWSSIGSDNLLQNASRGWSIGPQFTLPILNGQRLQHQIKANQAVFDGASANYKKVVLNAVGDVELALSRVGRSEESRQQLLAALHLQQQTLNRIQRQLTVGEVSRLTLIENRKLIASQQDQILQAQMQSLSGLIALYKALGGGWY